MSLSEQTARVAGGGKNTLKTILQKLGVTVGAETIDQYPALAEGISEKLNPNRLLSAETAARYGENVKYPDDVFVKVKDFIEAAEQKFLHSSSGSYVGTGSVYKPEMDIGIEPDIFICGAAQDTDGANWIIWIKGTIYAFGQDGKYLDENRVTVSGTKIRWDNTGTSSGYFRALNAADTTYRWLAIKLNS